MNWMLKGLTRSRFIQISVRRHVDHDLRTTGTSHVLWICKITLSCIQTFLTVTQPRPQREAYPVQSPNWWKPRESKLKRSSKNSEKNHECTSRSTPSTYKISWSNSSYSNSYKKDKFGLHLNVNDCQKICLFCNCKCKMNLIVEIYM